MGVMSFEDNITHFMRSRKKKDGSKGIFNYDDIEDLKKNHRDRNIQSIQKFKHRIACSVCSFMAIFTSFYMIWYPAEVVFDEVHFGSFTSHYIKREYFFDVHPPLGKLMFAAVGYFIGFDGEYLFENIGGSYLTNQVPYISFRVLPATLNVASVALVYKILFESGYSVLTCSTTAILYLFDNSFITHNRLILLDSSLIFFMLCSIYSYIRVSKLRNRAFTGNWWLWLTCTGISIACTTSVKLVGLFVVFSIGIAVIKELWDMLNLKRGLTKIQILVHFLTRFICLFIMPILIYLFWFYVHFSILNGTGTGDTFMTVEFQRTLKNHIAAPRSLIIHYNQSVALMNIETAGFLHSHQLSYPMFYLDGRVSSQGQQVVGNTKLDPSSFWRVRSPIEIFNQEQRPVRHNDIIQLEHVLTGNSLITHDVAAPILSHNQEVIAINEEIQFNATLFRVILDNYFNGDQWQTLLSNVRLEHILTGTSIVCSKNVLPAWGAHNLEVSASRSKLSKETKWIAAKIQGVNGTDYNLKYGKKITFLEKVIDLHKAMFRFSSGMTAPHPYQSSPYTWPLMLRGISYWIKDNTKSQIYLTGNIASWWLSLIAIVMFAGVIVTDSVARQGTYKIMNDDIRRRMIKSGGFFLLLWANHYLPFFIMGRSLFLHHYLPAMTCSYLVIGAMFQYLFVNGINSPVIISSKISLINYKYSSIEFKSLIAAFVLIAMQFVVFVFLAPLTYGTPNLSSEQISKRKIMDAWDIHYTD